ncbi:MAG TPA: nuclear transport factor 2 family protein [Rectinemataceae bacterium]|nr:nuclear transport factor 2 family protein [Rectinemataceae bacterium]
MRTSLSRTAVSIFLASMLLVAGAAVAGQTETAAFKAAVDEIFQAWSDSSFSADSAKFGALWDQDAIKMAAGRPTAVGRKTIEAQRQAKDKAVVFDKFEVKIEEYQLAGDFGWARGKYTIVAHPRAGGSPATDTGVFLTIFKMQADGSWRVYRDTMMPSPQQ